MVKFIPVLSEYTDTTLKKFSVGIQNFCQTL